MTDLADRSTLVITGGFGLGFTNTGLVDVVAAAVPILLSATSVGLVIATIWAAALARTSTPPSTACSSVSTVVTRPCPSA